MYSDIQRWNLKYCEGDRPFQHKPDETLVRLKRSLSSGGDALDVACGSGQNSRLLNAWGYNVYAVDGSIEALLLNRKVEGGSDIAAFVADLDAYPLPTKKFDLIIVIHYLNRGIISALIEALRPGGRIFFKTFNENHLISRPGFNPDYVLKPGDLSLMFAGLTKIAGEDPDSRDPENNWILAEKA